MPDREKVIRWLDVCKTADRAVGLKEDYPCRECPYKDSPRCMRELVADALALLKEQEAVEPIPFFTETGAESPKYVICGHCKSINAIMPKATKQKYCHECGFPVLWKGR